MYWISNVNIHIIHRIQRDAAHLMSYCKGLCCQWRRALRELRVNKNITYIKISLPSVLLIVPVVEFSP